MYFSLSSPEELRRSAVTSEECILRLLNAFFFAYYVNKNDVIQVYKKKIQCGTYLLFNFLAASWVPSVLVTLLEGANVRSVKNSKKTLIQDV